MLFRGGVYRASPQCALNVLHPLPARRYSSDNAGSIVVDLDYAGLSVLLTGDIEADGLDSLLRIPPRGHRLVMAPHHGSMNNSPHRFVPWSQAQGIVISEEWLPPEQQDLSVFENSGAPVYLTGRDGAIRLRLDKLGRVDEIRAWRRQPWPAP
jgi:competence protein ComEC